MWSLNYKNCTTCKTTSVKHKGHGLCNDCWQKKWSLDNPERKKEIRQKEYLKHKERYKRSNEIYKENNRENFLKYQRRYYQEHKEMRSINSRKWAVDNRKKSNHIKQEYKRRKRCAEGSHSFEDWENLKRSTNYSCNECKKYEPEIKLEADHIIPLSKNGTNYIDNIQPLCRSCNASKSNKMKI